MLRHLPWKTIVRHAARAYGVLDPAEFLARLRQFARPSEVQEPLELLRAGILFHARGLVNTKAIQHNLDWIWPYWVERQFNPGDPSFIPRAFSFSHINLTHRNWTAVGLPELPIYPIVDPRGLVTPLHDGWSIDFWLLSDTGPLLIPSKEKDAQQRLILNGEHVIETKLSNSKGSITQRVEVLEENNQPMLNVTVKATPLGKGEWLAAAIRPYNPEGVQFIDEVQCNKEHDCWTVNGKTEVHFDKPAEGMRTSHYEKGDVYEDLLEKQDSIHEKCPVGLATAVSVYRLESGRPFDLSLRVPLARELAEVGKRDTFNPETWREAESKSAELQVPDEKLQFLYDSAIHTMHMLSADEIYPGVYTYRRFWFRDACLMLNALLSMGKIDRCRRILSRFADRQTRDGYFSSQEGEWDSNGQVLWIFDRFRRVASEPLPDALLDAARKGVTWLDKKRLPADTKTGYPGLLPAGFSAEHLGTNDYYYWDDFWAVGGLRAIADTFESCGQAEDAERSRQLADEFAWSIERSLDAKASSRRRKGIPAAPGRRMDSGAVGSLVADYPLQLFPATDRRITDTIEYLHDHSFVHGGFFQEMIHSGINAYLTLDIAQSMLRAGDSRYRDLIKTVADLATSTGQWPEAIHPLTLGGCMGDGQHGWAAAEWIMAMRSCFVREEEDSLIFCSGIFPEWLESGAELAFGATPTQWGQVSVRVIPRGDSYLVTIDGHWHHEPPAAQILLPGCEPVEVTDFRHTHEVSSIPV
ncbi:MAG: hypothetical protein R3F19_17175 [Verrucomicrobiales bacterium]